MFTSIRKEMVTRRPHRQFEKRPDWRSVFCEVGDCQPKVFRFQCPNFVGSVEKRALEPAVHFRRGPVRIDSPRSRNSQPREKRPNRSTRATAKRIYRFYTEEGFAVDDRNYIRWTWRQGQNLQSVTYPNSVAHSYSYDTHNRLMSLAVALSCTDVPKIAV